MARSPSRSPRRGSGGGALGCVTGFLAARPMRWVDESGLRLMISLALVTGTYRAR